MVGDDLVKQAVSRVLQRSERQEDLSKILGTFVDVGILPQLHNRNNQIFYGRRGTGKTHVLRVLGSKLTDEPANTVVYIDARVLGSTAQFSDPSLPMGRRCLALFRDVLGELHNGILAHIIDHPPGNAERALEMSDALASSITEPIESFAREQITTSAKASEGQSLTAGVELSGKQSGATAGFKRDVAAEAAAQTSFRVTTEDKVIFPALHAALTNVLEAADTTLFILFDEWSSLPTDVQPYLAEFIRRSILPVGRAVIKIASLEYRSRFSTLVGDARFGFELGADISAVQDLDDYFVFDRNPEAATDAYGDMVYRHLASELPEGYLSEKYRVDSGAALASRLFTERAVFQELARAAEGVVRDLINIFTHAYFNALRRQRDSIDRKAVIEAARAWFEQDKATHLDSDLHDVLRRMVDFVIGSRRARSFMVPRELERHPIIQRLFDARVLHQMQRGYADKDNPGVRYNIYTLDYGTYVDLLGTSKQPELALVERAVSEEFAVPFDDKRSIRRIVLDETVLAVQSRPMSQRDEPRPDSVVKRFPL